MPSRFNTPARARAATGAVRHRPGKRLGRGLLVAAALATTISTASPVLADYALTDVINLEPAVIRVLGDGETYTKVFPTAPAIAGEIDIQLDAETSGRVIFWHVWPSIYPDGGWDNRAQFPELGKSESYAVGKRPKRVEGAFPFSIPRAAYEDYVLGYCNARADHLRSAEGRSNAEIFAEDHRLDIRVVGDFTYEMSGTSSPPKRGQVSDGPPEESPWPVSIVCEKSAALVTPPVVPDVKFVDLKVGGNDSAAVCSVSMVASIRTTAPHTEVKFRFERENGQKSEVHTVVTPGHSSYQEVHTYRLSGTGVQTGQVRMVIEGEEIETAWENYEINCVANDFATLLPPKATALTYVVEKEVMYQGKVCPSVITVIGRIDGQGKSSGTITLGAGGNQIAEKPFSITGDENQAFTGKHQIAWQGKPATQQDIPLALRVYGLAPTDNDDNGIGNEAATPAAPSQAPLQDTLLKTVSLNCGDAEFASNDPTPPVPTFSPTPVGEKMHQGYICPAEIALDAQLLGRDPFEGRAVLIARQQPSLFESQSQVKEYNFSVVKDEELAFPFRPEVRWSNVKQNGDAPPKQTMDLSFQVVAKAGGVVASVERSLEVRCKAVSLAGTAISFDPPKAIFLEAKAQADEILHQGRICPANITIRGGFIGHGSASGKAVLTTNGVVTAEMPYSIEDGQVQVIAGEHNLSWHNVPGPIESNVSFALRLYDAEGDEIDSMAEAQTFACRKAHVATGAKKRVDGLVSDETPQPKSYNLVLSQVGSRFRNGYVCPEKVSMDGIVHSGNEGFSGSVSYYTGAVQRHTEAVELGPNLTQAISAEHVLDWENGAFPEKVVVYAFKVENQYGLEVGSKEVTKRMACEKIETNRDPAVSGLSSGGSKPTHAQQGRKPAAAGQFALQAGPAFAIQAPKGQVRAGRIELSGGPADAKYDLRFYRGGKGGYRMLRSAQLPRQMTGRTASFDLKALSGSRTWRIEVCPAVSKSKAACKTSEFQLPSQRSSSKVKAPGRQADTRVFILPGSGN